MYQDEEQKSADDQESQRRSRRLAHRQRSGPADITPSGGQDTSSGPKTSKMVANMATKKRGTKSETGSKGQVRYTDDGAFEYYDPNAKQWSVYSRVTKVPFGADNVIVPAAYHNDHRQEFIEDDAPQDGFGKPSAVHIPKCS